MMRPCANGNYEDCRSLKEKKGRHVQWVLMEGNDIHDDDVCDSEEDSSSIDSVASISSSSSSLDMGEDASSSSSSPPNNSDGPLYELSDLMTQLPIKRGLSKHYQGKSQSFGSLASVKSLEDLAKKCYSSSSSSSSSSLHNKRRLKPCKCYGGGLVDAHKYFSPKPAITKNKPSSTSRGSFNFYMHI